MWIGSRPARSPGGPLPHDRRIRNLEITLVGVGIAGLTAARALQRFGFTVRVYEPATRLGEVGAGLTVSPNATHLLEAIGRRGVLGQIGMRRERGGVKHWRSGRLTVEIPRGGDMLDKYGAACCQVHRAVATAGSLEEALRRDVEARQPRTTRVMLQSREAARNYHSGHAENFQPGRHVSAESPGIMAYNPAAVAV